MKFHLHFDASRVIPSLSYSTNRPDISLYHINTPFTVTKLNQTISRNVSVTTFMGSHPFKRLMKIAFSVQVIKYLS